MVICKMTNKAKSIIYNYYYYIVIFYFLLFCKDKRCEFYKRRPFFFLYFPSHLFTIFSPHFLSSKPKWPNYQNIHQPSITNLHILSLSSIIITIVIVIIIVVIIIVTTIIITIKQAYQHHLHHNCDLNLHATHSLLSSINYHHCQ